MDDDEPVEKSEKEESPLTQDDKPSAPRPSKNPIIQLRDFLREKRKEVEESIVHYGPPYHDEYGGNLPEECQDPKTSVMDVHGLLNEGADPRIGDAEDYHNTPLHYACRNSKLSIAKMLVRAGASVNQVNELGVAPLGFAVMFEQPEPKRKAHRKLITWLIGLGADVNHVDRGGHTAIELASGAGSMPMVTLLLRHGARVKRDAEFLSMVGRTICICATAKTVTTASPFFPRPLAGDSRPGEGRDGGKRASPATNQTEKGNRRDAGAQTASREARDGEAPGG